MLSQIHENGRKERKMLNHQKKIKNSLKMFLVLNNCSLARNNVVCLTRKNFFGDVISDVDLVLGVRLEVEVVELDGLLVKQPHLVLVQLGGHDSLVEVLCNKNRNKTKL
jgi:hypothetical protein